MVIRSVLYKQRWISAKWFATTAIVEEHRSEADIIGGYKSRTAANDLSNFRKDVSFILIDKSPLLTSEELPSRRG
jgi:hypothetical protein